MPFKSQAQRRKFYAMESRGEISKKTLDEWNAATPKGKKLPEKVKKSGISVEAFFDELQKISEEKSKTDPAEAALSGYRLWRNGQKDSQ